MNCIYDKRRIYVAGKATEPMDCRVIASEICDNHSNYQPPITCFRYINIINNQSFSHFNISGMLHSTRCFRKQFETSRYGCYGYLPHILSLCILPKVSPPHIFNNDMNEKQAALELSFQTLAETSQICAILLALKPNDSSSSMVSPQSGF